VTFPPLITGIAEEKIPPLISDRLPLNERAFNINFSLEKNMEKVCRIRRFFKKKLAFRGEFNNNKFMKGWEKGGLHRSFFERILKISW
jgi:hypothetical protein